MSSTDDGDDLMFEQDTLFLTDVKEDAFYSHGR